MDTSSESEGNEASNSISIPAIATAVCDERPLYKKQLAVYLVLGSILFERIAFYSLTNNIIFTVQSNETVSWTAEHSETASLTFFGVRYVATFVFAALCDSRLGRRLTIIIGFILYLIGYFLIIIIFNEKTSFCNFTNNKSHNATSIADESCSTGILSVLICAAVGAGTVQSNLAVFGAEQIRELKSISRYAGKFQITLAIGDIIALFAVPRIQAYPKYFYIGYTAAAGILLVSLLLFVIACRFSIHIKPYDTILTKCIPVFINAYRSWKLYRRNKPLNTATKSTNYSSLSTIQSLDRDDFDEIDRPRSFLDYAKITYYGKFHDRIVNDVRALQRTIIVFSILLPYWIMYTQINTTFVQQGKQMKLPWPDMPRTWIGLIVPIATILGIVIFEIINYKYFLTWKKERILVIKFILGMCFAILAMITAGLVELSRQNQCPSSSTNTTSNLSIFNQLPQYSFIGLSIVFTVVASFEYAYYTSPRSAQSLFMSFRFTAAGIAQFISTGISNNVLQPSDKILICQSFGNAESWRYYTYFFLLAGVQFIFSIVFVVCYKKYQIIRLNPEQVKPTEVLLRTPRLPKTED